MKRYFIAINQAIVPTPYGMDSLYPGITLIQDKQDRRFLESFENKEVALMFMEDVSSSAIFVENYQESGNLHAVMKEYILFERKATTNEFGVELLPVDAEAIGYSKLPEK